MKTRFWILSLVASPCLLWSSPLAKPEQLQADGKAIDTRGNMTYAGPLIGDLTGDGKADLTVTTISGVFLVYENSSSTETPIYRKAEDLPKEKVPPSFQNW